jgi:phosphatidylglycerol:prolipoprotein diacylglycerol transferase
MHPVLFETGSITVYTYGFCIALGALSGVCYLAWQGKKQFGLTFDQTNTLFLWLVAGGVVGGKVFLVFENPSYYFSNPKELLSGSGFVFYGSLLTCIPLMLWFFRRNKLPLWPMLDIMAIVTCILHCFGRIGCFMAGCCYGLPTDSTFGVVFTSPVCQADPLNTPLHPTQLYEASWILLILVVLLLIKTRRLFEGQLFLIYLMAYAFGRGVIEIFRGDLARGFVIPDILSISQLISLLVIVAALFFYVRRRNANLHHHKPQ